MGMRAHYAHNGGQLSYILGGQADSSVDEMLLVANERYDGPGNAGSSDLDLNMIEEYLLPVDC